MKHIEKRLNAEAREMGKLGRVRHDVFVFGFVGVGAWKRKIFDSIPGIARRSKVQFQGQYKYDNGWRRSYLCYYVKPWVCAMILDVYGITDPSVIERRIRQIQRMPELQDAYDVAANAGAGADACHAMLIKAADDAMMAENPAGL